MRRYRPLRLVGLHGEALAVEHGGFARTIAFGQRGADFRRGGRVFQRTRRQPELHAKPGMALLDHDDRAQVGKFRVRLQQAAPQRAQGADGIGAAEVDGKIRPLHGGLGSRRLRAADLDESSALVACLVASLATSDAAASRRAAQRQGLEEPHWRIWPAQSAWRRRGPAAPSSIWRRPAALPSKVAAASGFGAACAWGGGGPMATAGSGLGVSAGRGFSGGRMAAVVATGATAGAACAFGARLQIDCRCQGRRR